MERLPYSGNVFNLTVKNDKTFCTSISVVHNCRCVIIPINKYDFTREMLSSRADIPGNFPDPGFG